MSTQAYFISGDSKFYLKAGVTSGLFLKKINLVDPTITGTQTVNGDQRVNGNLYLSNLDVNNIDYALFSGLNVLIKSGDIVSDSNIFAKNLVYNTGNQTISGVKTFATEVTAPNLVYNSGYQVINGSKTFNDSIIFYSGVTFLRNGGSADADIDLLGRPYLNTRASIGTDTGILGQSINTLNTEREIKIWETGGAVTAVGYGPYIRIGRSGVLISEKTESKVGIGTLFPKEKLHISGGNLRVDNSGIFSLSGATPLSVPNNPLSIVGSGNTYLQVNIQNIATGTTSTADLVITANNGTDTTNYINLGINNSGYNDPAFSNGSGYDGYLFVNGGSLDIGTQTVNTAIEFHAGGTTANRVIARIDGSGLNIVSGNLRLNNTVMPLTGDRLVYINMNNNSDTMAAGINYFGQLAVGYKSFAGGRAFQILQDLIIKKATWTHIVGTLPVGTPNNTNGLSSGFVVISSNSAFTSPTFGLISENVSASGDNNAATNFSKEFNPPLKINSGDYIVGALTAPLWSTSQPATTRNSINLYCYY
jgi:hypothetical protein